MSYKSNKSPDFLQYFEELNAKVVVDEEIMNANLRLKIVYYMVNATKYCNKIKADYNQEHCIEVIFVIVYSNFKKKQNRHLMAIHIFMKKKNT